MIVCIRCSSETRAKMDILIADDDYADYSELVAVAIDNLWVLAQDVTKSGAVVIGGEAKSKSISTASSSFEKARALNVRTSETNSALRNPESKRTRMPITAVPAHIPDLFLSDGIDTLDVPTVEIPRLERADDAFTLDRWLFGQHNKLLPVKANCRALLRIASQHPEGIPTEDVARRIGEVAALLGDYLTDHDRCHQIARDDSLATAFPRSGPDAEKSRVRYANQFVGRVNGQGALYGMLWDYRLAAITPGEGARLMLTEPAVQFARLTNPVLDGCQNDPAQKFSSEEATFLLDHIRSHVPVEAFAFRTLIQAIADGAITPDKLDEALRVHVPAETNRSLSQSFLTSQRSGALSRMADLGLIARQRKGVRVSYTITPEGKAFVHNGNPHKKKENDRS